MQLYRFSPIKDEQQLRKTVIYIANETSKLSKKIIGKILPIKSLTVFSHYPDEFEKLSEITKTIGNFLNENNGPRIILHKPIKVGNNTIIHLRIRKPDPYRMQVGCNDFEIIDYNTFKNENLSKHTNNLRLIKRSNYEMIEFFDPDFDILAYVVSK
ncbi:MAG TPA: hypothetical protein PKZ92_03750 [Candidatus Woesebacteria bacterium]|jgi:acetyltransferase-like isoleucine patch superfamily enzyme|nr:hypothetical protein [Candidatus Shapirobacteria bacterium]HOR02342.1 hypothetical protein [Candidatus Woesebacteria bacterium]